MADVRVSENQTVDLGDIPKCQCSEPGKVRPNIVMFNDDQWNPERSDNQEIEYKTFMEYVQDDEKRLVILELGLNDEQDHFLKFISDRRMDHDDTILIKVPYRDPETYKEEDKEEFTERDINA